MEELLAMNTDSSTVVTVGNLEIGGGTKIVIAGPCAVESEEQIILTALAVKESGANILRGGAYKPRISPYSFRGMGEEGLKLLSTAGKLAELPVITEVMDARDIEIVSEYADILQVGSRNMQNFTMLTELGKTRKPVMLKRGLAATIEEWLHAAEYILCEGNTDVILCERGIRTFETLTRNTLDISAVPAIKQMSNLPIIVDPSHAAGKSEFVESLSLASLVAGADGIMVEVHPSPESAVSDGRQSLNLDQFDTLCKKISKLSGFTS